MKKEKKMPEWDLSEYYNGVDDPKIDEDIKKYAEKAAEFAVRYRGKVAKLEAGEFAAALRELEELSRISGKLGGYASLNSSTNRRFIRRLWKALTMQGKTYCFSDWSIINSVQRRRKNF